MSEQKPKGMFGITSETKDSNASPLLVATKLTTPDPQFPSGWKFPIANLVKVTSNNEYEKKDGSLVPVLIFIFKDTDGRQHTHMEWEVEQDDAKFKEKKDGLDVRIKHIFTAVFNKFPKGGIGTDAISWGDFFNKVRDTFESITTGEGEAKKVFYPTVPLYYKLTYYKARMGFPLSPNFLERVVKGQPCKTLGINLAYDKLESSANSKPAGIPGIADAPSGDDLPSFDEKFS